jgi:DNA processing protein
MLTDREQLILLNLVPGLGPRRARRLLDEFGGVQALAAAPAALVQRVDRIGPELAGRIVRGLADVGALEQEQRLAARAGCEILTTADAGYPAPLRTIADPPPALYVKGAWRPQDEPAVALVGARRASLYGLEAAQRLAGDLAARGLTVVSGLARGIDAAAHRGCLRAQGRTVAVLGGGLSRLYPPEHRELAEEIARQGAVLSEFPMTHPPAAGNFPRRNRVISGLSRGVVVVEAGARSGALITADQALEQGREVFAVPGPITAPTSQGTHELLRQGARLVASVETSWRSWGLCRPRPGGRRRLPRRPRRKPRCWPASPAARRRPWMRSSRAAAWTRRRCQPPCCSCSCAI